MSEDCSHSISLRLQSLEEITTAFSRRFQALEVSVANLKTKKEPLEATMTESLDENRTYFSRRLQALEVCVANLKTKKEPLEATMTESLDENRTYFSRRLQALEVNVANLKTKTEPLEATMTESLEKTDSFKKEETTTINTTEKLPTSSHNTGAKRNRVYYILYAPVYIICFIVCGYYIIRAFDKWQNSPVSTATTNDYLELKDIPFPAVTICWSDRLNKGYNVDQHMDNCLDCHNKCKYNYKVENCSRAELTALAFAYQLCRHSTEMPSWITDHVRYDISGKRFHWHIEKLLPPCENHSVLYMSGWLMGPPDKVFSDVLSFHKRNINRCDKMFQQFLSDSSYRVCATFNSLPHSDIYEGNVVPALPMNNQSQKNGNGNPIWSYDNMLSDFEASNVSVPAYGLPLVNIELKAPEKRYNRMCTYSNNSIASVIVHSPNEIPFDLDRSMKIPIFENTIYIVELEPKITLAEDELAWYTPQQRRCFYSHEKNLAMFKFYTKANCELECIVNTSIGRYNCVPFYYPRPNGSVRVCTQPLLLNKMYCGCLPDCNSISYAINTKEHPAGENFKEASVVVRFTRTSPFYPDVRYKISNFAEFLAFSLGILGAFLGISVTCVWHLLYSEVERLPYSVNNWRKKKRSPSYQN